MELIRINEYGNDLIFGLTQDKRLLLFSVTGEEGMPADYEEKWEEYTPVDIILTGENSLDSRMGYQMCAGIRKNLRIKVHTRTQEADSVIHTFCLCEESRELEIRLNYQFYLDTRAFTCWTEITNYGQKDWGLEAVSSFELHGFEKCGSRNRDQRYQLHTMHNGWQKELKYQTGTLAEFGLSLSQKEKKAQGSKKISFSNTGSWSTKEYLPLAILEDFEKGTFLGWQIEQNGTWHWEIGESNGRLYLMAMGPTEYYGHWYHVLKSNETFTSVPVSVTAGSGNMQDAIRELTKYRRQIRRPNQDDENMPVIFNDYMNCLWGEPTTEKEIPLIDAAALCGCEYYVIDSGWYDKGFWWDTVGEWMPSEERFPKAEEFPDGLASLFGYIRQKGMVPGLWLELEVMGLKCKLADQKPQDWYFMRHGRTVKEKGRYQLDYRNPQVREFATSVVRRLVEEYKVGYIKMDYNIEAGIGTDYEADSPGDGLLGHNRAYLAWIDSIFERYPDLVIENCSSGGMRMDYAMLKRHSIQSTSDMEDYKMYATIAVNAPFALTPEQAAVWSYPLHGDQEEETIYNMVNVSLLRIHQSGHLNNLGAASRELITEAIEYYRATREDRKDALPFWPMRLADYSSEWVSLGLKGKNKSYLAVWRREGEQPECEIHLEQYAGKNVSVRIAYPEKKTIPFVWDSTSGILTVTMAQQNMARIFELEVQ